VFGIRVPQAPPDPNTDSRRALQRMLDAMAEEPAADESAARANLHALMGAPQPPPPTLASAPPLSRGQRYGRVAVDALLSQIDPHAYEGSLERRDRKAAMDRQLRMDAFNEAHQAWADQISANDRSIARSTATLGMLDGEREARARRAKGSLDAILAASKFDRSLEPEPTVDAGSLFGLPEANPLPWSHGGEIALREWAQEQARRTAPTTALDGARLAYLRARTDRLSAPEAKKPPVTTATFGNLLQRELSRIAQQKRRPDGSVRPITAADRSAAMSSVLATIAEYQRQFGSAAESMLAAEHGSLQPAETTPPRQDGMFDDEAGDIDALFGR
jgi:hypothetical protein